MNNAVVIIDFDNYFQKDINEYSKEQIESLFLKIALRAILITILLCFNIWSYTYYFKIEELQEHWSGLKYSPYDAYLPPNIDDFIFVWLASQILVIYLFLAIGISYLLKRKELLTKQDNGKAVPC